MNVSDWLQLAILVVLVITAGVYGWIAYLNRLTVKAVEIQTRATAKASEAQVFANILDRFSREGLSFKMDRIRTTSFASYADIDPALKNEIRIIADFFNDLGHLVRHGMVEEGKVMGIYRATLIALYDKLFPWWFTGIREEQGYAVLYRTLENLVERAQAVQDF